MQKGVTGIKDGPVPLTPGSGANDLFVAKEAEDKRVRDGKEPISTKDLIEWFVPKDREAGDRSTGRATNGAVNWFVSKDKKVGHDNVCTANNSDDDRFPS